MSADTIEATVEDGLVAFSITMIIGGPRIGAALLARILNALVGLLAEVERLRSDGSVSEWGINSVLAGHSEYSDIQRLALELAAVEPSGQVIPDVFALLAGLRTSQEPPGATPPAALRHIASLASPLRAETISEMWFSQPGETPVFVTRDTLHRVEELLGGPLDD